MLTYEDVKNNSAVRTYIQRADESLTALGYTEHSFAHVTAVAENAAYILSTLGYPERTVELAKIAGFLHDIGNLVNRVDHSWTSAFWTTCFVLRRRSQPSSPPSATTTRAPACR